MSDKKHYDICDQVITWCGGGQVEAYPLDDGTSDGTPPDLCDVHYLSYKRV